MKKLSVILSILLVTSGFLLTGCSKEEKKAALNIPEKIPYKERSFFVGFSSASRTPIQATPDTNYQDEALKIVEGYGEVVLIEARTSKPEEIATIKEIVNQAKAKQLKVAIGLNFFNEISYGVVKPENKFSNEKRRQNIENYIAELANLKPEYMGIGQDVYRYKFIQPADFKLFLELYNKKLYPKIKEISPQTQVAPVIEYEVLVDQQDFEIFNQFKDTSDFIAFTSYPYRWPHVVSPESMRDDYYTQATKFTGSKKVAFWSMAYPSGNGVDTLRGDFYSNPTAQKNFLLQFTKLTKDLDKEFIIWRFLFDESSSKQNDLGKYFRNTGLFDEHRNPKEAFEVWKKLSELPIKK